jgi:hypothetical protein
MGQWWYGADDRIDPEGSVYIFGVER